ncbi:MAG: SDR family oxidoreductase [Melioribacteraceae bacterium]|nr:SDR family oxidoreductase [Melioribacteraceae bacterium]MCF8266414.1 SDR family oxidoreductase [Melioribacteraceae bacterium]
MFDINGKNIVVTGGAGAIASSLIVDLSKLGAKVALIDYKKERANSHAEMLSSKSGNEIIGLHANVLDKEQLAEAATELEKTFGKADVLINAAGGNHPGGLTKVETMKATDIENLENTFFGLTEEGFKHVFDLNLMGTVLPTNVFARHMLEKGGSIINLSSMAAFKPLTKVSAYSAAKASINNFTEWLAVHFGGMGIRVNAVAPGFFVGKQNRALLYDENDVLTPRGQKIIDNTPMGRFGVVEELTGTVVYLASESSKFVTGVIIPVDGGFNAFSGV